MVSALNSRLSIPGLSSGQGHCVVFLGRTLPPNNASPPGCILMGTVVFNAGRNPEIARNTPNWR